MKKKNLLKANILICGVTAAAFWVIMVLSGYVG